jgi:RNA polymerase sigma-B factor
MPQCAAQIRILMDSGDEYDQKHEPADPIMVLPGAVEQSALSSVTRMDALLAEFAVSRDPEIRRTLILHHQKLVRHIATRFLHRGEPLEDLLQVGTIGLIHALDRYDPTSGGKFSTFAMPTIIGEIKRYFRDKTWHIKVPRWLQEMAAHVRIAQEKLTDHHGREPTVIEVATEIHASEEQTLEALTLLQVTWALSLDARSVMDATGEGVTLGELVGKIDQNLHDVVTYADIQRALRRLDARERRVITLRFFEELSQRQTAARLGLSQMQVSRMEKRSLIRLYGILNDINEV